jgi:arylsulfatase A-like enzyme
MDKRPNILFIMSDDHAANAIGAYGSRINATPNIDRLAQEGQRHDHCYVTNSICTPSRACILTGTHAHINGVTTLDTHLDNRMPNVAKHLQRNGYQTTMVGKWHLGEGPQHEPTGFDYWSVVPGQGRYYNLEFIEQDGLHVEAGYVTDVTADKCLHWLNARDANRPFFLMCHHKAPHRPWDPKQEHRSLYQDDFPEPETFDDDYANRASAAEIAKMRIAEDLTYRDLDLLSPDDPEEMQREWSNNWLATPDVLDGYSLTCAITGEVFSFTTFDELKRFKYNRYIRKYTQCIHSIDENVGRLLD